MKILVGEDDQAIAEVVTLILEGEGHEVILAPNEDTLIASLSQKPHIILLDISLGGSDGGKITKKLKKNAKFKDIPLIIVSANNDTEIIAKTSGANGFLLKPFEMEQLVSIVTSYS